MEIKPYWVLVAGFVLLLIFVIVIRMPSGGNHHRYHREGSALLGPGGTRNLLGSMFEGFRSGAVFTMFGVDWCPHCVKAKPLFESLGPTVTIGGHAVTLRYINPEQQKDVAKDYVIEGYPTFYFESGNTKVKYSGPRTAAGFQEFLEQQLSS